MQETWVQSLGQEDCLEQEMATHSSVLAQKIPWTEGPGGLQSIVEYREVTQSCLTLCDPMDWSLRGSSIHRIFQARILDWGSKELDMTKQLSQENWATLPTKVCLVKAMVFSVVMYGGKSWTVNKLNAEELMLFNYGVGEDSWKSLGLQGDPISPS